MLCLKILILLFVTRAYNPFQHDKILDQSKFKEVADDILIPYLMNTVLRVNLFTFNIMDIPQQSTKPFIISAIDFGSTYSGYAYTYRSTIRDDPSKVYLNYWTSPDGGAPGMAYSKVPTVILFDQDNNFHSFGNEAERNYARLAENDNHKKWRCFKNFKMKLYDRETGLHKKIRLRDEQGKQMPALDVFSASIRYLAGQLLSSINKSVRESVRVSDVEWLLTVPAIWTDGAKQFMQLAAVEAGLPENNVSLALEPEAAAVYISQVPLQIDESQQNGRDLMPFEENTKFMLIDLGGGTIDMTFHQVQRNGCLQQVQVEDSGNEPRGINLQDTTETVPTTVRKHDNLAFGHSPHDKNKTPTQNLLVEIHAPEGGQWGGNLVNEELEQFLERVFTEPVWTAFKTESYFKEIYLDLLSSLEVAKKKVESSSNDDINITIPQDLSELFQLKCNKVLENYIHESPDLSQSVSFKRGKLRISHSQMRKMFDRSLHRLVPALRDLEKTLEVNNINTMVLVGGFSESRLIQQKLKEEFENKSVIVPEDPSLAVLKGAVIYGHNKRVIRSRIMKHTYGISIARTFRDGIDPAKLKVKTGKGYRCENVFDVLIRAGDTVYPDETAVTRQVNGIYNTLEKECHVSIYISPEREPMFVSDQGCQHVGSVKFTLDTESKGNEDRLLDVTLYFGHTRIKVTVKEHNTGRTIESELNCLN